MRPRSGPALDDAPLLSSPLSLSPTFLARALIDDRPHDSDGSPRRGIGLRGGKHFRDGVRWQKGRQDRPCRRGRTRAVLTTDAQGSPSGLPLGTLLAHLSRSPAPPPPPPPPPFPPLPLCASSCAAMIFPERSFLSSCFAFTTEKTADEPRSSSRGGSPRIAHYLGGSIAQSGVKAVSHARFARSFVRSFVVANPSREKAWLSARERDEPL